MFCLQSFQISNGDIVNDDGSYYTGEMSGGVPNGYGEYYWSKTEYYKGQWKNGKFNGNGIKLTDDGTKYEGMWAEGRPNGYGK